jgi:hypothetical protein
MTPSQKEEIDHANFCFSPDENGMIVRALREAESEEGE